VHVLITNMEVDKSWIILQNRRCPDFLNGLKKFMEIAKNHVNGEGKGYCPCKSCANSKRSLQNLATIYAHIHDRANRSKQLYKSYHGTQSYAQRRYDEVNEGGVPQHVEGRRNMHFKGSSGWYNQLAEEHWVKRIITDELNKAKSTSGDDDTPVDEMEVMQRSLGERGVGM
ncbi:hypothetical protein R6Q57_004460, partial [Mikania cordata]